jgi:hypothetical protein
MHSLLCGLQAIRGCQDCRTGRQVTRVWGLQSLRPAILPTTFHDFPQSVDADVETEQESRPRQLPVAFFPTPYSLIILPNYTINPELMTASLSTLLKTKMGTVTGKARHNAPCRVVRSFPKRGFSHDTHTPREGFLLGSVFIFKINTYVYFYYTVLRTVPEQTERRELGGAGGSSRNSEAKHSLSLSELNVYARLLCIYGETARPGL